MDADTAARTGGLNLKAALLVQVQTSVVCRTHHVLMLSKSEGFDKALSTMAVTIL